MLTEVRANSAPIYRAGAAVLVEVLLVQFPYFAVLIALAIILTPAISAIVQGLRPSRATV